MFLDMNYTNLWTLRFNWGESSSIQKHYHAMFLFKGVQKIKIAFICFGHINEHAQMLQDMISAIFQKNILCIVILTLHMKISFLGGPQYLMQLTGLATLHIGWVSKPPGPAASPFWLPSQSLFSKNPFRQSRLKPSPHGL